MRLYISCYLYYFPLIQLFMLYMDIMIIIKKTYFFV